MTFVLTSLKTIFVWCVESSVGIFGNILYI
jgi:hypothetical protein